MILDRLREETRPAHESLEARIDLLGRPWAQPFYSALLQRFYGFYATLEPAIAARPEWQQQGFDIERRRKLPLLRRDLQRLGLDEAEIQALPRCDAAPEIASFAAALGVAYVLEGSTLGGQIITRHLHRELAPQLGGEANLSCQFFGSYGAEVGPMWREFVQFLNTRDLDEPEQKALIESACETFSSFEVWLSSIL